MCYNMYAVFMYSILHQSGYSLPGHGTVLHVTVSLSFPGQPTPIFDWFADLHRRIRYLVPPPQDREHVENDIQLLQVSAIFPAD